LPEPASTRETRQDARSGQRRASAGLLRWLTEEAFALARKIAPISALAAAACLGSVTRGINVPIGGALAIEASYFARIVAARDIREGRRAWLEKRAPEFSMT